MINLQIRNTGESFNTDKALRGLSTMPAPAASTLVLGPAEVLELAQMIEPRMAAATTWYLRTPIKELGDFTARQLVEKGQAELVVAFLLSIYCGDRG